MLEIATTWYIPLMKGHTYMFWSHTIWYVLLGLATLVELAILLWRSKRRTFIIAFFFSICGMAFSFEMAVLSYFKAYSYTPMLIPQSPSDDSIAGNLFSQSSVSATAVLIALFRLRYYWYILFSLAYGIIEELFLFLGIYRHNWYQTWMTIALLPLLFWITSRAYHACFKPMWRYLRYVFIFLGLVTLHVHTNTWMLKLVGLRDYSQHLLPDKDRSIVVLSMIYTLVVGSIIMFLYFSRISWRWKVPVILVLYMAMYIAEHYKIIIYTEGWFFIATSISIWGMYFYTYLLDQMYNQVNHLRVADP